MSLVFGRHGQFFWNSTAAVAAHQCEWLSRSEERVVQNIGRRCHSSSSAQPVSECAIADQGHAATAQSRLASIPSTRSERTGKGLPRVVNKKACPQHRFSAKCHNRSVSAVCLSRAGCDTHRLGRALCYFAIVLLFVRFHERQGQWQAVECSGRPESKQWEGGRRPRSLLAAASYSWQGLGFCRPTPHGGRSPWRATQGGSQPSQQHNTHRCDHIYALPAWATHSLIREATAHTAFGTSALVL